MIDLRELKSRHDEIAANIKNRNMRVDLDAIIALGDKRSSVMQEADALRARRNEVAKQMKGKLDPETRAKLIEEGKELKTRIAEIEKEASDLDAQYLAAARTIPNYANPKAPIGKEDKDSTAVKFVGKPPVFDFKPLDHVQLGDRKSVV